MARHIMLNGTRMPSDSPCLKYDNRRLLWGDSFTVKLRGNSCRVYDFNNYFLCICKMAESIGLEPDELFKPKIFANDLMLLLKQNRIYKEFCATITIFRNSTGTNKITDTDTFSTLVSVESLPHEFYSINKDGIFTDVFDSSKLITEIANPNFSYELISGKILAENDLDDLIITDNNGNYRRSLYSDIFFLKDKSLIYASDPTNVSINAIFSSRIMQIASSKLGMEIYQSEVNQSKLKGVEGMFLADPMNGIRWVVGLGRERFYSGMVNDIAYEVYNYYKEEIERLKG